MSYLSRSSGSASPNFTRRLSPDSTSSRSSRSSSSSSPNSDSGSHTQGPSTFGPAPKRSEYAAYAALLRDGRSRRSQHGLAHRLWQLSTPRSSVQPASSVAPSSIDDSDVNSPASSVVHDEVAALSSKVDVRWPLDPSALPATESLEEMIQTIASRCIRSAPLVLPPRPSQDDDADLDVDDHEDLPIPLDLVQRTTEFVNRVLVGLAVMRPSETRTKRKRLDPIGWEGVLGAAALAQGDEDVVRNAHARLRQLYPESLDLARENQSEDRYNHRLEALSRLRAERPPVSLDELYTPVLPLLPKARRMHQSPAEVERRAAKRKARLDKRQAKEAAKLEAKRLKLEERAARKAKNRGPARPADR
ncbi:hypothetical protein DB88DRAFT_508610 [Papiliotrema laurentii]|uniref:Uncharacterized protein n=1 Tax=Papiliotrema laurentii TaxID=5418 RepID=A0AAD9L8P6_PAPLA|nr:hypothetical protein DB88DRAFT_508610 [Papiliotrema laurentii]